jgi:hypothetical protein
MWLLAQWLGFKSISIKQLASLFITDRVRCHWVITEPFVSIKISVHDIGIWIRWFWDVGVAWLKLLICFQSGESSSEDNGSTSDRRSRHTRRSEPVLAADGINTGDE